MTRRLHPAQVRRRAAGAASLAVLLMLLMLLLMLLGRSVLLGAGSERLVLTRLQGMRKPPLRAPAFVAAEAAVAWAPSRLNVDWLIDNACRADGDLAAHSPDRPLIHHFGSPKSDGATPPGVERDDSPSDGCTDTLRAAIDRPGEGARRVWVRGGLRVRGPLQLGTPAQPPRLVMDLGIEQCGPGEPIGRVQASRRRWSEATPGGGALLRGVVRPEEGCTGQAAADLVDDLSFLLSRQHEAGSRFRVPCSWHDDRSARHTSPHP